MINKYMMDLKKILEKEGIEYSVVCEVGVFSSKESHVKNLIDSSEKVIMIEANPSYAEEIKNSFKKKKNVIVYNKAVYNENKKVKLFNRKAASFIEGLNSPNKVNKGYVENDKDAFYIQAHTFDWFDDGDIDVITCDIEGAEWYVLEKMISRPKLICVETHSKLYDWQTYINPHISEIENWMKENNYIEYSKDIGDTIYLKK